MKSRLVAPCWNLSKKRAFHLAAFAADAERCLERYERLAEQALQYACRLRLISRNARRFLFCQSSSLLTREKLLSAFLRGRVTEGRPCTILELPPDPFRRRGSLPQKHKTNTGAKTNIGALHPFRRECSLPAGRKLSGLWQWLVGCLGPRMRQLVAVRDAVVPQPRQGHAWHLHHGWVGRCRRSVGSADLLL